MQNLKQELKEVRRDREANKKLGSDRRSSSRASRPAQPVKSATQKIQRRLGRCGDVFGDIGLGELTRVYRQDAGIPPDPGRQCFAFVVRNKMRNK